MYFVYILETGNGHWYVGLTDNIERRLNEHNSGKSIHTNKFTGWNLKTYVAFESRKKAQLFEKYLKSHSGRAFAKKRL